MAGLGYDRRKQALFADLRWVGWRLFWILLVCWFVAREFNLSFVGVFCVWVLLRMATRGFDDNGS